MDNLLRLFTRVSGAGLLLLAALALPVTAEEAQKPTETGGRAVAMEIEAEVTAIDLKTREVSLRLPSNFVVTVVAPEKVIKLEDVSVGDRLVGTFFAALEAEVRTPTAEETAEPWKVLEEESVSDEGAQPGIDSARLVRAVVTIEGMNRESGVVVVKDSRGKLHMIGDVAPEKMTGVAIGQTAVIVFTEALALTLEKKPKE